MLFISHLTCERNNTTGAACQAPSHHAGFFTVALVPHWDVDDPVIERSDRGIDAFREHAAMAARRRQLG